MIARSPALVALLAGLAALVGAHVAVRLVRRYSLRHSVLDQPSERSSHTVPTPRGGGLGVVLAVALVGVPTLAAIGTPPAALALGALAVAAVAAVGWMDDHRPLPARARLVVHLLAGVAVACIADRWLGTASALRWLLAGWWIFWTVSSINVVNFMDGIDGLIGSQLAIYAAYVALLAPPSSVPSLLGAVVAGASLGFLHSNWAPAAIFLGDVGSGAYGILAVLVGLGLVAPDDASSFVRAYLPLFPLFLDASVTLVRRARVGERLTTPHRSHLYQRLANGPWGHARTALAFAMAAALGALVGLLPRGGTALLVTAVYCAGTVFVGRRIERLAPWQAASVPVTEVTDRRTGAGEAP